MTNYKLPMALTLTLISISAFGQDNTALIDRARQAAPAMISENATIMYRGETLHQGTNEWICLPETMPDDNSPSCNDSEWMKLFSAVGTKGDYTPEKLGFSYMLAGDQGVSNSDPYHEDPGSAEDFIKEGPHLMLIVPHEMLEGITDDPSSGSPYVMWKDTAYAHIMIPVGDR